MESVEESLGMFAETGQTPSFEELKKLMVQTVAASSSLHRGRSAVDARRDDDASRQELIDLVKKQSPHLRNAIMFPELWQRWLDKLESKGFFNGAPEGSEERSRRVRIAGERFAALSTRRRKKNEERVTSHILQQPMSMAAATSAAQTKRKESLYSLIDVD